MPTPLLKWAGGKSKLLPKLKAVFEPERKILVEPFVGSAVVFLNTDFDEYVLGDINPDLINFYTHVCDEPEKVIELARPLFENGASKEAFVANSDRFNSLPQGSVERSALFLYLNKFGFNGLCRYNRAGKFNVSFGKYTDPQRAPKLAESDILAFAEMAKRKKVKWVCGDFQETLSNVTDPSRTVVYLDPPYCPIESKASFTKYAPEDFGIREHLSLSLRITEMFKDGVQVIMSNSDTITTSTLYETFTAVQYKFEARRSISCLGGARGPARELLLVWSKAVPRSDLNNYVTQLTQITTELLPSILADGLGPWMISLSPNTGEVCARLFDANIKHPSRQLGFYPALDGAYGLNAYLLVHGDYVRTVVTVADEE